MTTRLSGIAKARGHERALFYSDLHFHIKRTLPIDAILRLLAASGDVYSITGRGQNWAEGFEHTYGSFRGDAAESRGWGVLWSNNVSFAMQRHADGVRLYFVKAQEILTAEHCDIVAVGADRSFSDGIGAGELARSTRASGGFAILAHPYYPMMRKGGPEHAVVMRVAEAVDAIEAFNQQVAIVGSSYVRKGFLLSAGADKPAVATSDTHLYRLPLWGSLRHSGVQFLLRPPLGDSLLPALKAAILSGDFTRCELTSVSQLRLALGLSLRQARYLYRFGTDAVWAHLRRSHPAFGSDRDGACKLLS